mgnify:CR=1 FL=1
MTLHKTNPPCGTFPASGSYGHVLYLALLEAGFHVLMTPPHFTRQIRGRVGRSKLRAYAFFMTEPRKPLTPQAEKRLRVLGALDSLGAGFTLASQDLDIRGAGNLLGDEQSGHVAAVGFELYCQLIDEAVAEGSGRAAGRAVRLPLGRPADRVAGRGLRGCPRGDRR